MIWNKYNCAKQYLDTVTVSTVKLAAKSFAQIAENLKHVSSEDDDLSNKVNPDSTTTKCVEHFHSLAHRKAVVDSDSEDGTYGGIFTSVNQNRVTRSGRRIVAPKHFMYDEESGILYTICITKSNNLAFSQMILSKQS